MFMYLNIKLTLMSNFLPEVDLNKYEKNNFIFINLSNQSLTKITLNIFKTTYLKENLLN